MASPPAHALPAAGPALVLASTSPYRMALLQRLRLPFETLAPAVDETPRAAEAPRALALRLAQAKAEAGADQRPQAWVIGADQVADLDGQPLGKPGDHAGALAQWRRMRGREVRFHSAVWLRRADTGFSQGECVTVRVQCRAARMEEIDHCLRLEPAYDCAGSAKVEGLGITLLEAVHSDDPTALIGLPLLATCRLLRAAGLDLPAASR